VYGSHYHKNCQHQKYINYPRTAIQNTACATCLEILDLNLKLRYKHRNKLTVYRLSFVKVYIKFLSDSFMQREVSVCECSDESSEANIHECIVKKRAKHYDYLFTDYSSLKGI
jgi:hypothetical protein